MPTFRRPSPTPGLLAGLLITLAAVVASGVYVTRQVSRLRTLQTDITDGHRRDSLQLLRIQNDLNSVGLAMRDMLDNDEGYPLTRSEEHTSELQSQSNLVCCLQLEQITQRITLDGAR